MASLPPVGQAAAPNDGHFPRKPAKRQRVEEDRFSSSSISSSAVVHKTPLELDLEVAESKYRHCLTLGDRWGELEVEARKGALYAEGNPELRARFLGMVSRSLNQLGRSEEGIKVARDALELKFEHDTVRAMLTHDIAFNFFTLGNYQNAQDYGIRGLEYKPQEPYVEYALNKVCGEALFKLEEYDEAAKFLKDALKYEDEEISPSLRLHLKIQLAESLIAQNKLEEALEIIETGFINGGRYNPQLVKLHVETLVHLDRLDKALSITESFIGKFPKSDGMVRGLKDLVLEAMAKKGPKE